MPLSKHYFDTKKVATPVDLERLSSTLQAALPQVVFAYLHGSAVFGDVPAHSDLDPGFMVDSSFSRAACDALRNAGREGRPCD